MITMVKLGGSLITDKTQRAAFRKDVMARLAAEFYAALQQQPDMPLIIGHGSGSFGHFEAQDYDTISGVYSTEQWRGFARVAFVAAELNYLVTQQLHQANVPVFRFQPSASIVAKNGIIQSMAIDGLQTCLEQQLIPLIHGDVAFDSERGGTIISTETMFSYLVRQLPVSRIFLLGEVDGVYDLNQNVIGKITPANFADIQSALAGSAGVDVTGGMLTKVKDMLELATAPPYPTIYIMNGQEPDSLGRALLETQVKGTRIAKL